MGWGHPKRLQELLGTKKETIFLTLLLIPIRVQKRNFELRAQVSSIQRDKLFPIHSDFVENYTLERELVLMRVLVPGVLLDLGEGRLAKSQIRL